LLHWLLKLLLRLLLCIDDCCLLVRSRLLLLCN
jgi:hypothetical protein